VRKYALILEVVLFGLKIRNDSAAWRLGHFLMRGGDVMVTYEMLFAYTLVIIAIITICLKLSKDRDG